jgi:RNase P/RNase MRP subunit p30
MVGVEGVKMLENILMIPRIVINDINNFKPSESYLVAYKPSKKEHARRAGKVKRVSTILFDENNIELCDEEQVEVMKRGSAALELLLRPLLDSNTLPKYLFMMRRCLELAYKEGIDILISSGARSLDELWPPGTIWALGSMIGFRGISSNWIEVLRRWRPGLHL